MSQLAGTRQIRGANRAAWTPNLISLPAWPREPPAEKQGICSLATMKHGSRNEVANTGVSSRSSVWGGGFDQGILDATLLTKTEMKGVGGEMRSSLRSGKP